jgi:hypothetical protein
MTQVCRWCDQPIAPDGRGNWVHVTRGYACRNRWGVLLTTSAAPHLGVRWTTLYRSGWAIR